MHSRSRALNLNRVGVFFYHQIDGYNGEKFLKSSNEREWKQIVIIIIGCGFGKKKNKGNRQGGQVLSFIPVI